MSLIRCKKCRGTKKLMGMGGIYKNCDECNGVGQVDVEDAELIWTDPESVRTVVTPVIQVESEKVVVTSVAIEPTAEDAPVVKKKPKKKKPVQLDMTKPENAYV